MRDRHRMPILHEAVGPAPPPVLEPAVSKVVLVLLCFGAALLLLSTASGLAKGQGRGGPAWAFRLGGLLAALLGTIIVATSMVKVIDAGKVGVKHAFGRV